MCPQLQWPWGKLCLLSIEAHPGLKPAETAILRDVVKVQSPYSPKPVPPPLGLSLGASLPEVLVWLLMSSLSLQRWSQTSCAVSARCCESWTGTTPPASATEVRRTPIFPPGYRLAPNPHRSQLSVDDRVGGHGVAPGAALPFLSHSGGGRSSASSWCLLCTASAAFIPPLRGSSVLHALRSASKCQSWCCCSQR